MKGNYFVSLLAIFLISEYADAGLYNCKMPELKNGRVKMSRKHGIVYFRCKRRFKLVGKDLNVCHSDVPEWRDPMPVCVERTYNCTRPTLKNGHVQEIFRGRLFKFRCEKGFKRYGRKRALCNEYSYVRTPVCAAAGEKCRNISVDRDLLVPKKRNGGLLKFSCSSGLLLHGNRFIYCDGSSWSSKPPICIVQYPVKLCDFETADLCGWIQDKSDSFNFDWIQATAAQNKHINGTGPWSDHNYSVKGNYLFMKASREREPGEYPRIISPLYTPKAAGVCLDFYYHMLGPDGKNDVGSLEIEVFDYDNKSLNRVAVWNVSGNQGDFWHKGSLQIKKRTSFVQIVITATRGDDFRGDIAIDDFSFSWCTREPLLNCEKPSINNGRVHVRDWASYILFFCRESFEPHGRSDNFCDKGQWYYPLPVCVANGTRCPEVKGYDKYLSIRKSLNGGLLEFSCKYGLKLKGTDFIYCDGLSWSSNLLPHCIYEEPEKSCDFETENLCGWKRDELNNIYFEWRRQTARELTRNRTTKPDHIFKGDHVLLVGTWTRIPGNSSLFSPYYAPVDSGLCFEFWYYFFNPDREKNVGPLYVKISSSGNSSWNPSTSLNISEYRGDYWQKGSLEIGERSSYFQIIITATRKEGRMGGFVIDDLSISNCTMG
ncbi:MAM and LDL-receptor class A domain-containing protein 1-like [Saccostrea echinata]|uniref:MAM and LDL-receptor class A domain-containing protein 1-like n=1 Tax=Saccostrea echinata TaxID=191078 RepID=UPI002A81AC61|nr:MAM and LDL-receptor class A domain-containing protein 1-like [Saccostrea echinata]